MLVIVLKQMGLSENRMRELIEKLTRVKMVASAIFYTLMVFIVIFGISGDVYAGFPRFVPYVIIAVFLFMAFIRMYQCMVDDSYIKQITAKKLEENEKKTEERAKKAAAKTKQAADAWQPEKSEDKADADEKSEDAAEESDAFAQAGTSGETAADEQ